MVFKNRTEAAKDLARALSGYRGQDVVVYALPRGGVVLGAEVAKSLGAPLDLIIPRKIGHPLSPEYAIGAVTETGRPIWNTAELVYTSKSWRQQQVKLARAEAKRRRIHYLASQQKPDIQGKTAIVVDDGIATGLTMVAAVRKLRKHQPKAIVVAVPVASEDAVDALMPYTKEIIALELPSVFIGSIGNYYQYFPQIEDEEVRGLLDAYRSIPADEPLDLASLNSLLAATNHYPITSSELASQAKRLHTAANVVAFFESIPAEMKFDSKADVMRRAEETEILMTEAADQPSEHVR